MSLIIRDTGAVPPQGWTFHVEQTGYDVRAPNYNVLFDYIRQHCEANGIPTPDNQVVIDWMCANLHVPCYDSETRQPLINKLTLNLPVPPTSCCGGKK